MKFNRDHIVAILAALAAALLPVLIQDHFLTGRVGDIVGAVVGTFVVGYHVNNAAAIGAMQQFQDHLTQDVADAKATVADVSAMSASQGS